jgi:hypothetical protein
MNKHIRDCIRFLNDEGVSVYGTPDFGKHLKFHTNIGTLIFPSTPSDSRWLMNMKTFVRRRLRK